jgi:very-short-patch-repair endonuclease
LVAKAARYGRVCNELVITPLPGSSYAERTRRQGCADHPPLVDGNVEVLGLLARQDGLVADVQAVDLGMTARTLRRRVQRDGWTRVAPGVLLAGGHPWTDRARLRAVGLWAGRRGVLSGPAAAWWHGMRQAAPDRVELTVARRCGLRDREGVQIRHRDLDLAFTEAKVAVEVDGWAWHVDVDRFRADRRKGNALANAGWTVLRFTWHDLTARPGYVVAEIRAALA